MPARKFKLFFSLLAVALNIVGAPIVNAHMARMDHASQSTVNGMEHCEEHMNSGASEPDSSIAGGHLACCKSGVCSCGCLHAAAISVLAVSSVNTTPESALAPVIRTVAASAVEDPLRPPIT